MPFPPGKTGFVTDRPSAGIWQGAITHFYNSFLIYFSANCQSRLQYSWAEGPVMIKRNGYYYYFPAGDVTGGQYALRGTALTADSAKWERLGDFFKPITDPKTGFRRPNHITPPVQRADGTWWTMGQSYEKAGNDDWKKIPDCKQRNDVHQIHSFVTGKIEY